MRNMVLKGTDTEHITFSSGIYTLGIVSCHLMAQLPQVVIFCDIVSQRQGGNTEQMVTQEQNGNLFYFLYRLHARGQVRR